MRREWALLGETIKFCSGSADQNSVGSDPWCQAPNPRGEMNVRQTTPFRSRTRLREEFEARTDSIADHLGDMISAHTPDGTYKYASAAAKDVIGYEPIELMGKWAYDYFHPEDINKVSLAHQSALDGAPYTIAYR